MIEENDNPKFESSSIKTEVPVGIEIKRVKHLKEDGTYEVTMALTEQQTYFLLTMIINILIAQGVASYRDVTPEENTQDAIQKEYLDGLSPKDLPQS